jgi:hypothetical protein
MKKVFTTIYFLLTVNFASAMNAAPFNGSVNQCRDFIVSIVGENSQLEQITPDRVRKWRTFFKIIMSDENKKNDEIFLQLRLSLALSIEEVNNTLDEVLELSCLIKEHCRLIGEKHPINFDDIEKCVELLAFLTS